VQRFEELLIDNKAKAITIEGPVFFGGFIQNRIKDNTRSDSTTQHYANRGFLVFLFEKFLDSINSFFANLEHTVTVPPLSLAQELLPRFENHG
jgi:hypothetical protein